MQTEPEQLTASGVPDFCRNPVTTDVARENRRWVQDLTGPAPVREAASGRLYALLLRVTGAEAGRRAASVRLAGPEVDDLAHQAASDALLKICTVIGTFRGECRFTTWAYKFAVFEVTAKVNRHFWRRAATPLDYDDWDSIPSAGGLEPELEAESHDLAGAVTRAVHESLTDRQRTVFVAVAMHGTPMVEVATMLNATSNAIYKTMFDARRKLRKALEADGYLARLSA